MPGRPELRGVPRRRRRARAGLAAAARRRRRQLDAHRLPADRASGCAGSCSATSRRSPTSSSASSRRATSTSPTARSRAPTVEADEVPLAIDELPLVALLGCFAEGETVVRGRAGAAREGVRPHRGVVEGLRGLGAEIEATEDGFVVTGTGGLRGGHDRLARRPPPGDAGRGRRARLARGRRGGRDGRGGDLLPGLRRGPRARSAPL